MLHFLKDLLKFIQIHQYYTMALNHTQWDFKKSRNSPKNAMSLMHNGLRIMKKTFKPKSGLAKQSRSILLLAIGAINTLIFLNLWKKS